MVGLRRLVIAILEPHSLIESNKRKLGLEKGNKSSILFSFCQALTS